MSYLPRQRDMNDELVVIGIGETDHGKMYQEMREDPNHKNDNYMLAYTAFKNALDDSGIQKDQIDGLITEGSPVDDTSERCWESTHAGPYSEGSVDA